MAKSMAREKRPDHLDTEDHVTERVLDAAAWAETHRRAAIAGGIALVAVVAAAFYYQDYRQKVVERASVRLQEIQISSQSADIVTIRSELRIFIDQYSGTSYSHQARVALGGLELRRDSLGLAIQALEPVADLGGGNPLSFAAMEMIAAAYEQGGDAERALQWYERFESDALFDYQRHFAVAEQARLHTIAGHYSEAAALYEALVDEIPDDPAGQEMYAVRLGEVRALDRFGAVPSAALPTAPTQAPGTETETDEAVDRETQTSDGGAIDVEPQGEGEEPGN